MAHRVLSLFSGIGGMDMGFSDEVVVHRDSISYKKFILKQYKSGFVVLRKNNFTIVFQNDILQGAKSVCAMNGVDVSNYLTESIYDLLARDYSFPSADVVIGGFPCNDFSHCGKREGFKSKKSHNLIDDATENDNRGTLYRCFVEVVARVKPKVFVAENVYGLLTMKGEPIKQIVKDFEEVGYDVSYQLVDCSDHGVPQIRKRVIIMGISRDRKTDVKKGWNLITKNKATCHVGRYLSHLAEPDETDDISQQLYSKAKKLTKGQGQKEIDMSSFSPTIRAEHHGNIEFRRHEDSVINPHEAHLPERRLTLREAGLIQTFPPDYIFTTKKTMTAYKYIGNAVPPLLGYLIADKVNSILTTYF